MNWDLITPEIVIGSCPMVPNDVKVMAERTGITAILSLQTDEDLSYYNIDEKAIIAKIEELGLTFIRIPMEDFNLADQKNKLFDAVNALSKLITNKHKVYVHCTAGVNRSPLTVLGYMCFVQKMSMFDAFNFLRIQRPVCEPYLEVIDFCLQKLEGQK